MKPPYHGELGKDVVTHGSHELGGRMSPSTAEVRAWFAQVVTDRDLARYMDILRADPHWHVATSTQRGACIVVLSHWPTGEDLAIMLWRDDPGGVWRPQPL